MAEPVRAFALTGGALRRWGEAQPVEGEAALLRDGLHSRRLLLLKTLLTRVESDAPPGADTFREHWELLERAEARGPGAARRVLGHPSVGSWLVEALEAQGPERLGEALAGFGAVAATAAARAGLRADITLPVAQGRLAFPGVGGYAGPAHALRVTLRPEGPRPLGPGTGAAGEEGAGWRPLRALPGGNGVLDDQDPYLFGSAGPVGFSPLQLEDGASAAPWLELWSAALALLRRVDPARADEVVTLLRSLVPVAHQAPGASQSATCWSAPWAVLTTLPASAEELAGTLVHEIQHSKLSVLEDLVPLHDGAGEAVYRIGWRQDPRPLGAVVQGAFAHLALADLWYAAASRSGARPAARARARRIGADYGEQVADALSQIRHAGELTYEGREFVSGMLRRHTRLEAHEARHARAVVSHSHYG